MDGVRVVDQKDMSLAGLAVKYFGGKNLAYLCCFVDFCGLGMIIPFLTFYVKDMFPDKDEGERTLWVGAILTAQYSASVFGATLLGWSSDVFGRKAALLQAMLGDVVFFAASGAVASVSVPAFVAMRALAGLMIPVVPATAWLLDSVAHLPSSEQAPALAKLSASLMGGMFFGNSVSIIISAAQGGITASSYAGSALAVFVVLAIIPQPPEAVAVAREAAVGAAAMVKTAGSLKEDAQPSMDQGPAKLEVGVGGMIEVVIESSTGELQVKGEIWFANDELNITHDASHTMAVVTTTKADAATTGANPARPEGVRELLCTPRFLALLFDNTTNGFVFGGGVTLMGEVLTAYHGWPKAAVSGMYAAVTFLMVSWSIFAYRTQVAKMGLKNLVVTTNFMICAAAAVVALTLDSSQVIFCTAQTVSILGVAWSLPSLNALAAGYADKYTKNARGTVLGLTRSGFSIGQAVSPICIAALYAADKKFPFILVAAMNFLGGCGQMAAFAVDSRAEKMVVEAAEAAAAV